MKLYTVDPNYTAFLHTHQNVHYCTDPTKESRPYALVIVSIRQSPQMPFLVPLTSSFDLLHSCRPREPWERVITDPSDPSQELGMMLFSKMIPAPTDKSLMKEIIFEPENAVRDAKKIKEKKYIDAFESKIHEQATRVYTMKTYMKEKQKSTSKLYTICVDYQKLQKLSSSYTSASASASASDPSSASAESSTSTSLSSPAKKRAKAKAKKEEAERKVK